MEKDNLNLEIISKSLFKNVFYSFLEKYGTYILILVLTFLIARLLPQEEWGILILAQSIITIMSLIIDFFPPGLNYSLVYYVSTYQYDAKKKYLKSFIINSLRQKLIFLFPSYLICLFIIYLLNFNFYNPLILYILSPIIIFSSLNLIFNSIIYGYNLYKTLFFITIFQYSFHIICYITFILVFGTLNIISIAIILTSINLFILVIKSIIIRKKIKENESDKEISNKFKQDLSKNIRYGFPLVISSGINSLWIEFKKPIIGILLNPSMVTITNMGENISLIPLQTSASFQQPIISSFSKLDKDIEKSKISMLFKLIYKFALISTCLSTAIFIIIAELYIFVIYGESYLQYKFFIQIILIHIILRSLGGLLVSLLLSINKTKFIPLLTAINTVIQFIFLILGTFLYQLDGYAFGLIISMSIIFIIQFKFLHKLGGIKLPKKETLLIIFIFFDSLIISIFLRNILIQNLYLLNDIIAGIIFFILFSIQIILFKIISKEDLDLLESFFVKDSKFDIILRRIFKFMKRII